MDDCARELGTVVAGGSGRVTDKGAGWKVAAARLRDTLPGLKYRAPLVALQLAVAFVLLVASANLAHLVLARNESRRHELALRLALGARPLRLARQLLLESLLVGAAGGALGLGLAAVGMHVLRGQLARPGPSAVEATLDGTVLTVTLLVSLLTSAVFGVLPAVRAARMDPARELKRARGAAGARWGGLAATLVTAEVASAVVLLVAAGLMVRTLRNLALEDPGFRAPDAYSVRVSFPPLSPEALQARADGVIARLDALPGVEAAGAVAYPPLVGYNPGVDLALEGREAGATPHHVHLQFVSPGYFDALGIPLRRGRALAATDVSPHPESVLVNERLAAQLGPPNDVLGGRVRLADDRFPSSLRVVGVVGDVQQFGPGSGVRPEVYVPAYYRSQLTYVVRTRAGTGGLVPALAQAVHREGLAAGPPRAMTQALFDFLQVRRVLAGLLGTLAVVSLLLAASGISSVVAYGVSRRTREIGIRMALGARAIDARRMVLGETLRRSLAGTVLGLAGAWAVSRGLRRMLFGVTPSDPVTLAFVITLLVAVALLASYWPARRASKVDPIVALREE
jgi:predicted permease